MVTEGEGGVLQALLARYRDSSPPRVISSGRGGVPSSRDGPWRPTGSKKDLDTNAEFLGLTCRCDHGRIDIPRQRASSWFRERPTGISVPAVPGSRPVLHMESPMGRRRRWAGGKPTATQTRGSSAATGERRSNREAKRCGGGRWQGRFKPHGAAVRPFSVPRLSPLPMWPPWPAPPLPPTGIRRPVRDVSVVFRRQGTAPSPRASVFLPPLCAYPVLIPSLLETDRKTLYSAITGVSTLTVPPSRRPVDLPEFSRPYIFPVNYL